MNVLFCVVMKMCCIKSTNTGNLQVQTAQTIEQCSKLSVKRDTEN